MAEPKYTDLKITDDEIELDSAGIPVQIYDRDVIAQDVRHMIRESGLLPLLVAERSRDMRGLILKRVRMLIETDQRIVPGSTEITEPYPGQYNITAESEFGKIAVGASA